MCTGNIPESVDGVVQGSRRELGRRHLHGGGHGRLRQLHGLHRRLLLRRGGLRLGLRRGLRLRLLGLRRLLRRRILLLGRGIRLAARGR
ncbi:hypothetical protein, partial [Streptomyces sp. NPDC101166]|uniref:hypothetical protein n=1 Tax=Streptomyces sp. NPDC101166 TaxID=3366120 RepID=UPI00382D5B9D